MRETRRRHGRSHEIPEPVGAFSRHRFRAARPYANMKTVKEK